MSESPSAVPAAGRATSVLVWWHAARVALSRLREDLYHGATVPEDLETELQGMGLDELDDWFGLQLLETQQLARFALLAAAEALFMEDFRERVRPRRRDTISKGLREVQKHCDRQRRRVVLDPDVLDVWKTECKAAAPHVSKLRGELKYRHWVAHGMYWEPKLGARPRDPVDLFELCKMLFEAAGIDGWTD